MIAQLSAFGAGLLFGIGLWLSGMANPRKVLDFLDVAKKIELRKEIDAPLLAGAAIFGIGWGIGGYCPGPALTALSNLSAEALVFVAAMVVGGLFARIWPSDFSARRAGSLAQR